MISKRFTIACTCICVTLAVITGCTDSKETVLLNPSTNVTDNVVYPLDAGKDSVLNLLQNIPNIDWHAYNKSSDGKSLDTIEFLYNNITLITPEYYSNLFLATKGLDGASSESYSAIVGELYQKDRNTVVETLATMEDQAQQQSVISFIAYNLGYLDVAQVKEDISTWKSSGELSSDEKVVLTDLLAALDNP
ncbi:hypothetical protein [Paenibacillus segetis]|uniref:Uncharacterized protein n=1 Tax=Paenibacillus segetis TaxID=1325360 RepID=A0ABQ1YUV4_9BACL|nr:hypothetical protein [Paenibacillus segetis]GGH36921.1 hypothetical protein GCM10008013_44060 [Paenibacillus segetis]